MTDIDETVPVPNATEGTVAAIRDDAERLIARLQKLPGGRRLGIAIERGDVAAVSDASRWLFFRAFAIAGVPILLIEALVAYRQRMEMLSLVILATATITLAAVLLTWKRRWDLRREAVVHVVSSFSLLAGGLVVVLQAGRPEYVVWGCLFIPIAYYFFGSVRALIWILAFASLAVGLMYFAPRLGWARVPDDLFREIIMAFVANAILLFVFQLTRESFEAASVVLAGRLAQLAETDPLTGLHNRRRLESELSRRIAEAGRSGMPLAIVLADLDRFKNVNDRFGHHAGDEVLQRLGDTLRAAIRASDVVGRWGGEEFLLVLPGTNLEGAVNLAEKLRREIERRLSAGDVGVTCSFGTVALTGGESWEVLLRRADGALYAAKEAGRNRVVAVDAS